MRKGALFMGLASEFLFDMATPLSKALLSGLNPFMLAGLLYFVAALAMALWPCRTARASRGSSRTGEASGGFRTSWSSGHGGVRTSHTGLRMADAASMSIWLNLELVATAVFKLVFFKERLDAA